MADKLPSGLNEITSIETADTGLIWDNSASEIKYISKANFISEIIGTGSTDITTLGTIATGVWNGTALTADYVPNHDSLNGFVADEHIAHSGVNLTAGDGLTGGGTIAASRSFAVGEGTGITVSANSISTNDSEIVHDNLSGFIANEHINHTSVTLTAGAGLTGGGTIAASRSFALSHLGIEDLTDPGADRIMFWDESENAMKWLTAGDGLTITDTTITASHNELTGLQGGAASEYYHLTSAEYTTLQSYDANLATLSLPASTTISAFGASIIDDVDEATFKATVNLEDSDINTLITATKLDDLSIPDDNTDLDATTSRHGLLPKLSGGAFEYLRSDGTWVVPVFAIDADSGSAQTVTPTSTINFIGGTNCTTEVTTNDNITINVNDAFLLNDGDIGTGVYDFGGATTFEIPNSDAPTANTNGHIAIDNTVVNWSHGLLKYYSGEILGVVAMPYSEFNSPNDGYVVAYNAANDEFELVAAGTGSGTVTSVAAGDGMDFTEITTSGNVTMGTPGTLTSSTSNAVTATSHTHNITTGIANTNILRIDDADAADNDYLKLTANGAEGRSFSEVKTDLSLDNVENTAISSWSGSSNIVTLGTIGTGIWQGTAIDGTYINIEGTEIKSTGETGGVKYLREDGDGTCSWQTIAGGGDVTKVGTPVDNEIGVWTGDGTIEGDTNFKWDGSALIMTGTMFIKEQADADADKTGYGQIWVNTATPNELYFTNDTGTDYEITGRMSGFILTADSGTPQAITNANTVDMEGGAGITTTVGSSDKVTFSTVDSEIVHNDLSGYVANEHIDWTADQGATNINTANITGLTLGTEVTGELANLTDVGSTTPTNRNALMADGDSWESRALVEDDISDLDHDAVKFQGVSLDSSVGTPSDGDILVYRSAGTDWVLEAKPAGGSNPAINDITDITITTPADNELLAYDSGSGDWINQTPTEVGVQEVLAEGAFVDGDKTRLDGIEDLADVTDATNVEAAGAAMDGGAFHDGFSDFVANEHIDWTSASTAMSISSVTGNTIALTPGDAGNSQSTGGAFLINNTNNPGSAIVVYTNEDSAADGHLVQFGAGNSGFDRTVLRVWNDGIAQAATFDNNNATTTSEAVSMTNDSPNASTLGVTGVPDGKGVIKVTHSGQTSDGNSSGISVDLAGSGTAAKGVYVDATNGGTTGNLLELKNGGSARFAVDADGAVTLASTIDGRDLAVDGSKLDGIEDLADVTDETNVVSSLSGATLSDIGTPASGDKLLIQDVSDSDNLKYVAWSEVGGGGGGGDFSDGGEAGGADRSLGNTDAYDLGFITNNTERISIKSNGNIIINDPSGTPGYTVDINGSLATNNQLLANQFVYRLGTTSKIYFPSANDMVFDMRSDEHMRFNNTGAVQSTIFNDDGLDMDFTVEASGVADAFVIQGSDGQITLGALTAGIVESDASGVLSVKTVGIADNNLLEVDDADLADNDYLKATPNGVEGRSFSEVKTDLSLDNVENTAISTWAGSENITTLGTIATGTWEGTAIDGTYIDIEGTEIKSTGEAGGTKFLREDGDGTCSWQTVPGGGGGDVATDTIWDAKGDLVVGTGADTASRLAVGTDDYVLMADSSEATGVKWAELGTAAMPIFSARTTATTDTAGTNVDVTWNTEIKKDTGFTHSAASTDIQFDFDGWVEITFAAGVDGATNRAETKASAYVDTGSGFAQITDDIAANYTTRDSDQNEGSVVLNFLLEVSDGDEIKFNIASVVDGGAANIDPTQTRVIIRRIDDLGEGIKGADGADGAQGPVGNGSFDEDAGGSDHTVSGNTVEMTVGENVVFGDVLYMKSDGKLWKADADSESTMPAIALATETIAADAAGDVLMYGFARDDSWSWTVGGQVYVSETAGGLTQTAPTDTDDVVHVVAVATNSARIWFNPQLTTVVHA